ENRITCENLEVKLRALETIIEETLIRELEQENTQLRRDLEYEQAINRRTINNLRNQVNILKNRKNIFTAVLNNQGQVIPRLRRQDAFIYKVEEDFET
ncbi:7278_t:CDS:2, partial [Dentiscutata erythropus]